MCVCLCVGIYGKIPPVGEVWIIYCATHWRICQDKISIYTPFLYCSVEHYNIEIYNFNTTE